ncbi:MAG: hypothetical protein O2909_08580, partial [Chloroflexi bacterium]|nr:hypothetical protein [Chloroflexota bacterium]
MLEYVRKCKVSYDKDGTACDYVRCVLRGAELAARCEHVVKKCTKAIVKLSKKEGVHGKFFTREEIREMAGFTPEDRYKGTGLWPWFCNQADVIEQEP